MFYDYMNKEEFTDEYAAKKFAQKVKGQVVCSSLESLGHWGGPRTYTVYYPDEYTRRRK